MPGRFQQSGKDALVSHRTSHLALVDELDKSSQLGVAQGGLADSDASLVAVGQYFVDDEVGRSFEVGGILTKLQEVEGCGLLLGQKAGVVVWQAVLLRKTSVLLPGQGRQAEAHRFQIIQAKHYRRQIRLGEITVIMGVFLIA